MGKVVTGGEIRLLDTSNFGQVRITKPVTISAESSKGAVIFTVFDGILVNVPNATDLAVIRGLDIEGPAARTASRSSRRHGGVEHCAIGKSTLGIDFEPTVAGSQLHVSDTVVSNSGAAGTGGGILVAPTAAPPSPSTACAWKTTSSASRRKARPW